MGGLFSKILDRFGGKQKARILILGLDAAGKTTILYRLQLGEVVSTAPTIGFHVEELTYKNVSFSVWDLGGQSSLRRCWRGYFSNTAAVVFVVDCVDRDRFPVARAELDECLREPDLAAVPLLVLANKRDVDGGAGPGEVARLLGLARIKDRPFHILHTSAVTGEGLDEAMTWLVDNAKRA
jgi:ADP-ribosylation factor-like protein 1